MVRKQQREPRSHLQAGGQETPAREVLSWGRSSVFSLEPESEGNILEEVEDVGDGAGDCPKGTVDRGQEEG